MAVPDTNTFSLIDVQTELSLPSTTSLVTCFSSANADGFDPDYEGAKDRLSNFRNYDDTGIATDTVDLGTGTTESNACTDYGSLPTTYFVPSGQSFLTATDLYIDSRGLILANANYYSDGINVRYWNGTAFTTTGACSL